MLTLLRPVHEADEQAGVRVTGAVQASDEVGEVPSQF